MEARRVGNASAELFERGYQTRFLTLRVRSKRGEKTEVVGHYPWLSFQRAAPFEEEPDESQHRHPYVIRPQLHPHFIHIFTNSSSIPTVVGAVSLSGVCTNERGEPTTSYR